MKIAAIDPESFSTWAPHCLINLNIEWGPCARSVADALCADLSCAIVACRSVVDIRSTKVSFPMLNFSIQSQAVNELNGLLYIKLKNLPSGNMQAVA